MSNVNTRIITDTSNLRVPLATLLPMQGCAYDIEVLKIPDELSNVFIVVFKPNGEHFAPFPLSVNDNGDYTAELLATHFPTAGEAKYEIFAQSESGNRVPCGKGKIIIEPFDSGSIPIPQGETIPVSEIASADGTMHRIVAVNVGTAENPDWTSQVEV